jgi:hypothetical protein
MNNCLCCEKKIGAKPQKYCTNCCLYTQELRRKVYYYKRELEKRNLIIYGTKKGNERLR